MKRLIAVLCFMLAATPFAYAQDKKDMEKKAPMAMEKAPAKEAPKGMADQKKSDVAKDKAAMEPPKAKTDMPAKGEVKKAPSDKQKARQAKKACNKEAKDKKLKGDERKQFVKDCIARS